MKQLLVAGIVLGLAAGANAGSGCTGADDCKACKTCKSCKHCHQEGGTCGVKQAPPTPEAVPPQPHPALPAEPPPRRATKPSPYRPWQPPRFVYKQPKAPYSPKTPQTPRLRRRKDGTYYWVGLPKPRTPRPR